MIISKSHCLVSSQKCQQATKSWNWQPLFQWTNNNISACARQDKITPNPSPLVPTGLLTKALCKAVLPGPVEDREAPKTLAWMPKKKRWHEFQVLTLTRTHKPAASAQGGPAPAHPRSERSRTENPAAPEKAAALFPQHVIGFHLSPSLFREFKNSSSKFRGKRQTDLFGGFQR